MVRPGNNGRRLFQRATLLHDRHGTGLFVHEHPMN